VIVLDVAMPGLDGLAVTRRLRSKGLAVPILLLTARDALHERVEGLDAGADDYLVKPFEVEELTARIRALMRRNQGETLAHADLVLDPDSLTAVADGGAALAQVERSLPDVIVLDVAMPGLDGLAVTRRLRSKGLAVPILLLTARDALHERVEGLDAGADDYLVKPFEVEELTARIRALMRRNQGETLAHADLVLDPESLTARRGGRDIPLTRREVELLELLLRNARGVVTRELALERVWGDGEAGANVVDRYVAYLRRKLGDPPLIHTVRGVGFRLDRE
jgi:two-component system, OmpR family, response regulator MprA